MRLCLRAIVKFSWWNIFFSEESDVCFFPAGLSSSVNTPITIKPSYCLNHHSLYLFINIFVSQVSVSYGLKGLAALLCNDSFIDVFPIINCWIFPFLIVISSRTFDVCICSCLDDSKNDKWPRCFPKSITLVQIPSILESDIHFSNGMIFFTSALNVWFGKCAENTNWQ